MDPTNFAALSATSVPVHSRPGRADSRSGHVGFRGVADILLQDAAQVRPKICHRRIIRAPPKSLTLQSPCWSDAGDPPRGSGIDALHRHIGTVMVQYQGCRLPVRFGDETDLGIFVGEFGIAPS